MKFRNSEKLFFYLYSLHIVHVIRPLHLYFTRPPVPLLTIESFPLLVDSLPYRFSSRFLFFVRKLIIQGFKAYQKNKNISYLSRVIVKTNKQHAYLKFIYLLSFLMVNFDLFLNINILIKRWTSLFFKV